MQAARTSRTHFEQLTEAFKLRAVLGQPPDAKGRALAAALLCHGIAEQHLAALRKIPGNEHIQKTALPDRGNLRQA